jgi:hypothetical protein
LRLKKRDRIHQVFRWLKHRHPTEGDVRLRLESVMPKGYRDCHGIASLSDSSLIQVSRKLTRSAAIYCLFHEYAHVIIYERDPEYTGGDHSDSFYRALGVVERSWLDGGEKDSIKF